MHTRYSDILKIKKQKLSEIERELLDVQNRKNALEAKITAVDEEISDLKQPQSGDFTAMQVSRETFLHLMKQKEDLQQKLALRLRQIAGLKELYQEANIDYEKIAYLHNESIKEALLRIKKEENKALDEIANILFVNQQEKEEV